MNCHAANWTLRVGWIHLLDHQNRPVDDNANTQRSLWEGEKKRTKITTVRTQIELFVFHLTLRHLLPFAMVSGTRTIEPGRAFIKLPAANGNGADTETGADPSWLLDDACDAFVSTFALALFGAHVLVVVFCDVEVVAAAGVSLSSWLGTTWDTQKRFYVTIEMKFKDKKHVANLLGGVRCA